MNQQQNVLSILIATRSSSTPKAICSQSAKVGKWLRQNKRILYAPLSSESTQARKDLERVGGGSKKHDRVLPDICVTWSCKASNSKLLVNISSPLPFSYYIFSTFLISKRVIYEVLIVKCSIHFYSGEDVRTLTFM